MGSELKSGLSRYLVDELESDVEGEVLVGGLVVPTRDDKETDVELLGTEFSKCLVEELDSKLLRQVSYLRVKLVEESPSREKEEIVSGEAI